MVSEPISSSSPDAAEETHISSLVVQVKPVSVPEVARRVDAMDQAEVAIVDPKGKLIVCLETTTLGEVTNSINVITTLPGVLGCTLVSHHVEYTAGLDEPVNARERDRTETTA
ncbi:MAG: chaperone NapD [Geminicoccaceae bacterium]